jgi:hypothetical protein
VGEGDAGQQLAAAERRQRRSRSLGVGEAARRCTGSVCWVATNQVGAARAGHDAADLALHRRGACAPPYARGPARPAGPCAAHASRCDAGTVVRSDLLGRTGAGSSSAEPPGTARHGSAPERSL